MVLHAWNVKLSALNDYSKYESAPEIHKSPEIQHRKYFIGDILQRHVEVRPKWRSTQFTSSRTVWLLNSIALYAQELD